MRARKPEARGARAAGGGWTAMAILSVVLFFFPVLASYGQPTPPRGIFGGSVGGLFPTGEFGDRIDQMGIGATLFYGWRLSGSPFFVGGELVAQEIGHSLFRTVDSYNAIVQGLAFVRIRPLTGSLVTYLEVLAGVTYLTTETDLGVYVGDDPMTEIDSEDLALAAGLGAGVSFCIHRSVADSGFVHRTYLDFNVRYMTGGRADYSVVLSDGSLLPTRSATSFLTAQVGISWSF